MAGDTTLTDFLLARLAEDERHARKLAETDRRPPLSLATTINHPDRLLAEVAAKRAIVEGIVPERDPYYGHPDYDAEWILKHLAAVYADHEDWREEWRP